MAVASGNRRLDDRDPEKEIPSEPVPPRRSSLRLQVAKLITERHEYICVLKDVSVVHGVTIRHFGMIPDSDHLEIGLANGEAIPVQLASKDRTHARLRFRDLVDPSSILKHTYGGQARRKLRLKVDASALLSFDDATAPATITNISQQGAAAECAMLLMEDQIVRLDIDGVPTIYAKVRWRRGSKCGLVFETTLSLEELASAVVKINMQDSR